MNKKVVVIPIIIVIIIIAFISGLYFLQEDTDVPEPGEIRITHFGGYEKNYKNEIYNYSIKFTESSIVVNSSYNNINKSDVLFIKKVFNRSIGEDIWNPLMKGFLENRGKNTNIDCYCIAEWSIEMIDIDGNLVVHGKFNPHKFKVYIQGAYTLIWVNEEAGELEGYNNLVNLTEILKNDIDSEYASKYATYIFIPVNEQVLISDDDVFYPVGGGGTGPHTLNISGFANDSFSGEIRSVRIHIKFKTDEGYENNNTLQIINMDTIHTIYGFDLREDEVVKYITLLDRDYNFQSLSISNITLVYENPGGIIPTPIIYFEYICIIVRSYIP